MFHEFIKTNNSGTFFIETRCIFSRIWLFLALQVVLKIVLNNISRQFKKLEVDNWLPPYRFFLP